ncbi:hypothetical protein M501DRAFT_994215 [Patellaria atrata CBS 101060]|uniref:Brl1/Brr6 domain-containing protein n=1 Tax=Patellaria atrata CBS 101060 TaxID=1346257 RepID=A0A9P4SJA9_9PEZI|nr:hypothetical protein M501DRAFT_994215 [Patellaria atrata CBS 101060]
MDRQSYYTPMDFEYDSKTGPINSASPFVNIPQQQSFKDAGNKKRTHSIFDSPSKPAVPSLREPASQKHFFSQATSKPLPFPPDSAYKNNAAFTTPRSTKVDLDFSSGVDTPNTPDATVDSDATPDTMGLKTRKWRMFGFSGSPKTESSTSPKKTKKIEPVSGSGIKEKPRREYYSTKAEQRIVKRRNHAHVESRSRKKQQQALAQLGSEISDSEHEDTLNSKRKGDKNDKPLPARPLSNSVGSLFSFLESHPNLPHILSFYAQLLLNVFLVFFFMYIVYSFWATIRSDVDKKADEAAAEIMAEIAICAQHWNINGCESKTRAPALDNACNGWKQCLQRDPHSVGRARVSAHTFAEIFNSFIEPISYKAMIFSLIMVFGCVAISNFAFSFFRNKAMEAMYNSQYMHHPPPPTPQRYPSGGMMGDQFYTPHHARYQDFGGLEPAPSGALDQGSPVKKLEFR